MWRRLARKLGIALNLRDPPSLPSYGWSYFDHLNAIYQTLNVQDNRVAAIISKSANTPDLLNWGDIFSMESVIFSLQPEEVVDRTAWIYRERFREIVGSSVYQKYVESSIPTDSSTAGKLSILKADLTRVLDVLHWYYALIPMRENVRKALTVKCLRMVLGYTVFLLIFLAVCNERHWQFMAMLSCVVYCGIVGGFVSSQKRMQAISSDADPLITVFGLDNAGYYLWLSPLLGAIFAVVLCLMFIAGVLKGAIFPGFFISGNHAAASLPFFTFTWDTLPTSSEEYAKLFVWAFLAGFAERLVPDSLDRLAAKLAIAEKTPTASILPPPSGPDNEAPTDPNGAKAPPPEQRQPITEQTLKDMMHTGEVHPPPAPGVPDQPQDR